MHNAKHSINCSFDLRTSQECSDYLQWPAPQNEMILRIESVASPELQRVNAKCLKLSTSLAHVPLTLVAALDRLK